MNDPLGLFSEDTHSTDPLGLFEEDESPLAGFGKQAVGIAEAGASLVAPLPSMIAGGVMGLGDLLSGKGIDRAGNRVREFQKSNFGLGQYVPYTEKGKQLAEKVGGGIESGLDVAGGLGQSVGGDQSGRTLVATTRQLTCQNFPKSEPTQGG